MPTSSRTIGYAGTALELTLYPLTPDAEVIVYLWGGGGGGGGADSQPGGNGTGGGYARGALTAETGDVLRLFVGGGGGGGIGRQGSAPGGTGGASYIADLVWSSRNLVGSNNLVPVTLGYAWSNFMNSYAVWDARGLNVDVTRSVNFPATANYEFQLQADNGGTVYLDGAPVLNSTDFASGAPASVVLTVTQGNHDIRISAYNISGPAGVAVAVVTGDSTSGAPGGSAGPAGSSGGGGGGGGATALLVNGDLVAMAAGGGGGGGAGRLSPGQDAPGPRGQSEGPRGYNGQTGQSHPGDGGGGGGGGGGWDGILLGGGGGNGGLIGGGDTGAEGGSFGRSFSNVGTEPVNVQDPNLRISGGADIFGYLPGVADGGLGGQRDNNLSNNGQPGGNGYALIYLNVPGIFVANETGQWVATEEIYIKQNGVWQTVNAVFIKRNGVWLDVSGDRATNFLPIPGSFGVVPRPAVAFVPPPAPTPSDGSWSGNDSPNPPDPSPPGGGRNADGSSGNEYQA